MQQLFDQSTSGGYELESVAIGSLLVQREKYENYPPCQRAYIWPKRYKQRLIDSILRGLPINPICVFRERNVFKGVLYWIVDGQQRLRTVFDFADGKFQTLSDLRDEPMLRPIEPDRYYDELSADAKGQFDGYILRFALLRVQPEKMGTVFRRMQWQKKLTMAERIWSYGGRTVEIYHELKGHRFFELIYPQYVSGTDRKQTYQLMLMALLMEVRGAFCNMTTPNIVNSAAGIVEYPNDIADRVNDHLNKATHAFYGINATSMSEFVPLYQAVMLLEQAGFSISDSEEGCLTGWHMAKKKESLNVKRQYGKDLSLQILRVNKQLVFWQEEWSKVAGMEGLFRCDPKRRFDMLDRLDAWEKQKGRCAVCGKTMLMGKVIGHHVVPHSQGGLTDSSNCMLVHRHCHQKAVPLPMPGV